MNIAIKTVSALMCVLLASVALKADANADKAISLQQDVLHKAVLHKAESSEKGVIVMLSARGDNAADATMLLLHQLKQNAGFAPMMLTPEKAQLTEYLTELSLSDSDLPAVIFYNKLGKEMSRVVAVKPVSTAILK